MTFVLCLVVCVVVVCGVDGVCVVVVVDCVVSCAHTGNDNASTVSDPQATADIFLSFIRISLFCLGNDALVRTYPVVANCFL